VENLITKITMTTTKKNEGRKEFHSIHQEYCCLNLVRAVESGYLDEVVSGIFFPNNSCCKEGIPRANFCPFCGAEIITESIPSGWRWWTKPHTT